MGTPSSPPARERGLLAPRDRSLAPVADPPEWVPDEVCGVCTACKAPFTVIRRKHHCRSCGKVGRGRGAGPGVEWGGRAGEARVPPALSPRLLPVYLLPQIFCSRCSSHSAPLPRYGQVRPVRVCTHCYVFHVTPFYRDKAAL